jgi:transposase InsO family protein
MLQEGRQSMAQAARKVTAKDAKEKLAHRRLTVLELAARLGNVAEACRRGGIDRTSFYEWKRRFQFEGLDGLKDLPPIAKSHPMTTPPEVVGRIEALALTHPAYGCNRLEALLALEGRRVSAITIQKILNDKGLGTRHERWLALERNHADQAIELTPEQAAFLEKLNPCFRERHVESERPGQLLSADTFMVGTLKGIGRVYLHAVVDTYGSYAFGFLHVSKQPEAAVAVLHNDVLPFYRNLDLPVTAVLTDNGREFCGTERHPYELYLALNDIEHRKTRVGSPRTNGFVERFNGTVLEECFQPKLRSQLYDSLEALQADLDTWLHHYNHQRPHLGYRNQGRRPWDTVELFVSQSPARQGG